MHLLQKKVLLCEDNSISADIISHILIANGMHVDWAENGQIGFSKFSSSAEYYYDVILMDIMMPVQNGIKTALKIRGLNRLDSRKVAIVALTANEYMEDIEFYKEMGIKYCIKKPINEAKLIETLNIICTSL